MKTTLQVKESFRSLIPPLADSEYAELEKSILAEGCREPLTVWDGVIVDGHTRYEICTKHGVPFKTQEKEFADEGEAMEWIITNQLGRRNITEFTREAMVWILTNQLGRRNITEFVRYELALKKKDILLAKGREKQAHGLTAPGKTLLSNLDKSDEKSDDTVLSNLDKKFEPHNTRKIIADELETITGKKTSVGTIARAEQIIKKAPEELKDQLRRGKISINKVYSEIRKQERAQQIQAQKERIENGELAMPDGLYDVIVIDPPWPYGTGYDPNGRRAASPYPEMELVEIKNIQIPAKNNCILFLWTTHKFMRHSFDILDAWGFRDVAIITWIKNRIGLGSWLRSQSEFCIMSVKGSPIVNLTNQSTIIYGDVREHSRKPDEFYSLIDSLCFGKKLDYFAREKRDGWDIFGLEEKWNGKTK